MPVDWGLSLIYSLNQFNMYPLNTQPLTIKANRVISEVRLRLLALSVAILGLVLAPHGMHRMMET